MLNEVESAICSEIVQQARAMNWGDSCVVPYIKTWQNCNDRAEFRVELNNIRYAIGANRALNSWFSGATYFEAMQKLRAAMPPESILKLAEYRAKNATKIAQYKYIVELLRKESGVEFCEKRNHALSQVEFGFNWWNSAKWEGSERIYEIELSFGKFSSRRSHRLCWKSEVGIQMNANFGLDSGEMDSLSEKIKRISTLNREISGILSSFSAPEEKV